MSSLAILRLVWCRSRLTDRPLVRHPPPAEAMKTHTAHLTARQRHARVDGNGASDLSRALNGRFHLQVVNDGLGIRPATVRGSEGNAPFTVTALTRRRAHRSSTTPPTGLDERQLSSFGAGNSHRFCGHCSPNHNKKSQENERKATKMVLPDQEGGNGALQPVRVSHRFEELSAHVRFGNAP